MAMARRRTVPLALVMLVAMVTSWARGQLVMRGRPGSGSNYYRIRPVVSTTTTTAAPTTGPSGATGDTFLKLPLLRALLLAPVGHECNSHDNCTLEEFCWANPFGTGNKCANARLWPCIGDTDCDITGEGHCYNGGLNGTQVAGYCGGCAQDTECTGRAEQGKCYRQHPQLITGQCSECVSDADCHNSAGTDHYCDVPFATGLLNVTSTTAASLTSVTSVTPPTSTQGSFIKRGRGGEILNFILQRRRRSAGHSLGHSMASAGHRMRRQASGGGVSLEPVHSYRCEARRGEGEVCHRVGHCQAGLWCVGNVCTSTTTTSTTTTTTTTSA